MLFRAVPASVRVHFAAVGALDWGGETAAEYGLEVTPAGASGVGASVFGLGVLKGA